MEGRGKSSASNLNSKWLGARGSSTWLEACREDRDVYKFRNPGCLTWDCGVRRPHPKESPHSWNGEGDLL